MLISGAALLMVAHRWQDAKASKKYSRTGAVVSASADEAGRVRSVGWTVAGR
ncbi:hypothetical protein [Nesterenkonia pannonica]|uniref:hypothetical protein n=1 Tax=Nesterenkonia pannonica TaxID=1548602 RepID=UPI0021642B28|nr:hypothetical protein [Nesterenkonia pannonica]